MTRESEQNCDDHQSPQKVLVDIDRRMVAMELAKECVTTQLKSCAIKRNFFFTFFDFSYMIAKNLENFQI